jgi:hypothetical protein
MPSTTKDAEAKMSYTLSSHYTRLMSTTTKDAEAICCHSLRSFDGGCMPSTRHRSQNVVTFAVQNSLLMTTSIKDALSHASVSGAVKR